VSLPSASLFEDARFNALVIVPNAVQGIFRRRRTAVAAATRANMDGHAVGLLSGMYRHHGGGPVWVRVMRDRALLLLAPADVHRALAGSPDPFASDPKPKRDGMVAFQPNALTISRGEAWAARRRFTAAVLETERSLHGDANRFVAIACEEAAALVPRGGGYELEFDEWNRAFQRIARRYVLGDAAADDEGLSELLGELMSKANGMPGETAPGYAELEARIAEYVDAAGEASLVGRFGDAPANGDVDPVGQVPHWLFATGDTLAANAFRALALIASHPPQAKRLADELDRLPLDRPPDAEEIGRLTYLEGCLQDAMRLYPTTSMLSRVTLADTEWRGTPVPAGTQVLIPNLFLHRDRERFEYADRFAPERWVDGSASAEYSFNHFSRGPQGCPGTALALLLGKSALATLLSAYSAEPISPSIDPAKPLPHMLDFFGIRVRFA
jgi:cytochrome P450